MIETEGDFKETEMEKKEGKPALVNLATASVLKIAYEVAEEDFARLATAWDLDTDVDTMTPEDADSFEQQKRKIVRQIVGGRAVINDEGNIEYTLFEPVGTLEKMILKRPGGKAFVAMDRAKDGHNIKKFNNMVGEATGQPPTVINRLDGVDFKFIQAVYLLFLGS